MTCGPALFARGKTDWETPDALFATLDAEHHFDLDVAASADNARCAKFYSVADNGLQRPWAGHRVWCNPPYGRAIGDWVDKAIAEAPHCERIVMLVPARTDTAWWHRAVATARPHFLRGRLRFKGASGSAPFPSALLLWGAPAAAR